MPDNKELRIRLNNINEDNSKLNTKVYELNNQIIKNSQECTDRIVSREKQMLSQLDDLEKTIKATAKENEPQPTMMKMMSRGIDDSTIKSEPIVDYNIIQQPSEDDRTKKLLKNVRSMREDILKKISD